jgi:hypothetical protein
MDMIHLPHYIHSVSLTFESGVEHSAKDQVRTQHNEATTEGVLLSCKWRAKCGASNRRPGGPMINLPISMCLRSLIGTPSTCKEDGSFVQVKVVSQM